MIKTRKFGELPNGETVTAYDFTTETGFHATILSYGATLQSLTFPDGIDVVLGFDNLVQYLGQHPYFGAVIGRVANRIAGARFSVDGVEHKLPENEGPNNLHSGPIGFDRVNWFGDVQGDTLVLGHTSPDGHQGFPGALKTELRFTLEDSTLTLDIQAVTDKACPVNITYHPYFNLTNGGIAPCIDHHLQIYANAFTPTDAANIPTGDISHLPDGGPYCYLDPRPITPENRLDQNFIIKPHNADDSQMVKMAKLSSEVTGHKVIICSTQKCLQAYTGSHIPKMTGKAGHSYGSNHGITLEPQGFPDALNHNDFADNILRPDIIYHHRINYTFRSGDSKAGVNLKS